MRALTYLEPTKIDVIEKELPKIEKSTDVIVKMLKTTICGTDLHIISGDTPEVPKGLTLGHEGVGEIAEIGESVTNFKVGDKVLISCITSCGHCEYCKRSLYAHCKDGGWILGHLIDGTQAEYVRIPHADNSLYLIPENMNDDVVVMLSDILPTGLEIGVLNGQVKPGDTLAIIGAGPVGIATLLTAQFYSPAKIIVVDLDDNRLELAKKLGATDTVNSKNPEAAIQRIFELSNGVGVDVAMEVVGFPATFDLCQKILSPGGRIANVGVHGASVELHLEDLWIKNITLTTGLVSTSSTPMLLKTVSAGRINHIEELITHHFSFDDILKAHDTFKNAAKTKALKVIIDF
ncbi:zinc-dependent alcohol dehydrogenase family protein [Listeria booriae]|uniref:Zinc-dependent alcohol dehydrogenase family protein n=1 Tax=Listeria booriae TaxID=1552123 RepID=A0A7X0XRM2_9LIST|nr:zinc-dependent alcohol dehydrogenase family protein [Listeria booriae]MBC1779002.1 zinc-dependent alcohol dehydrogenase family protein [Listeria booriae]MBC1889209.1 zinc-dependent alcohol dehydrogenase family protein [Listeria booriae]MBC2103505.1 zinc-dependent alcohol dehydrogenase family protein [Listeria booriae]MBC2240730.1 zinc-dependent alcohol dehydrogenase family protein [Listeria booriae]MBC2317777.1 zinc-dependent alcohol dehydrogenase family protein [Listeria booriae]